MTETLLLGCPHCLAMNRVIRTQLERSPRCGKCKQPLFDGAPVELTQRNFDVVVLKGELPVVVDFWASWCGPCKSMTPIFAEAAREMEPHLRFAKLDTESEQELAGRFGIRSLPTLMVFNQGREVARQPGLLQIAQLKQWLGPYRQ